MRPTVPSSIVQPPPTPATSNGVATEVARFVNDAFDRFERQVPDLPLEPTIGNRQNVMLAALRLSLLEAREEAGVERNNHVDRRHHARGGAR
jgi:hypothetical protein